MTHLTAELAQEVDNHTVPDAPRSKGGAAPRFFRLKGSNNGSTGVPKMTEISW